MSHERTAGLGIADIIGEKRQAILNLAAEHGATDVRVFGSVARGEARPDSDIDFIVKFQPDTSIFDQVSLWQGLTDLMGREIDLIADHPSGGAIMRAALKEAVPL